MAISPEVLLAAGQATSAAAGSAINAGLGAWQLWQAHKMNKGLERPTMEIPQSIQNAEEMSRAMAANPFLPNQRQMEQALDSQFAQGAMNIGNSAGSSSEALAALVQLQGSRMMGQNDLNSQAAINQQNNKNNYINFLQSKAPYEQQVWNYNVNEPYANRAAAIQALRGAGIENFTGGVKSGVNAAIQGGAYKTAEEYKAQEIENLKMQQEQQRLDFLKALQNNSTQNQNTSMGASLYLPSTTMVAGLQIQNPLNQ